MKLHKVIQAITDSLDDACVSRTLFHSAIAQPNPGPVLLRVHLKAFLYFFHEIFDFAGSKRFHEDAQIGPQLKALCALIGNSPAIKYLTEARDSMSHDPRSIITVHGGWTKVHPPERNPDGSFNLKVRWDHIPGAIRIGRVQKRDGSHVELPSNAPQEVSNSEIAKMMDSVITEVQAIIPSQQFK